MLEGRQCPRGLGEIKQFVKKIFPATLLFLFSSSLLFSATFNFSSKKQNSTPAAIEKPASELPLGEKLQFDVFWMGVNVGFLEAEIREKTVIQGRDAYHIVVVARTNEFLSALYPVHDEMQSWMDAKTFYSLKFRKTLSEGRYRADEEVEFRPEEKKGLYYSFRNGTRKEFKMEEAAQDVVSAFYWFRLQSAAQGQNLKTLVNSKEKNWDLEVKILGLETKVIRGLGSVRTICVEPQTSLRGALYQRGRAWVYFTTDQSRVPVWVTLKTPFGPIHGVLAVQKKPLSQKSNPGFIDTPR